MKRLLLFLSRSKVSRGAILFMAVGAIGVLSILVLGASSAVTQELKLAKHVTDSNTSHYLASSVVEVMKIIFANDANPQIITLYDLRNRWARLGDKVLEVESYDEQSRVNVNLASKDILARFAGLLGQEQLAENISAADITAKGDLLLLDGMNQEVYNQLKDVVTIFGTGQININTASAEVLLAVGLDGDLSDKIKKFRAGEDDIEATEDDKCFPAIAEIVPLLEPYGITPAQKIILEMLIASSQLTVSSDYVTFNITIKKAEKIQRFFNIVLQLFSGKIVLWQEE